MSLYYELVLTIPNMTVPFASTPSSALY